MMVHKRDIPPTDYEWPTTFAMSDRTTALSRGEAMLSDNKVNIVCHKTKQILVEQFYPGYKEIMEQTAGELAGQTKFVSFNCISLFSKNQNNLGRKNDF